MKNDLISRQAAIDALFELYEYQRDIDPTEAADLVRQGIFLAEKKIEKLPSAQPKLPPYVVEIKPEYVEHHEQVQSVWKLLDKKQKELYVLPSAQPEIIRCKNCKWCEDADGLMCKNPTSWVVVTDCDFGCVLAERRTDG